jgi:hypothetical protein
VIATTLALAGGKHDVGWACGHEAFYPVGDVDSLLDEVADFLTGTRSVQPSDRILASLLITDIVGIDRASKRIRRRAMAPVDGGRDRAASAQRAGRRDDRPLLLRSVARSRTKR